jgi:hypothetical protein
MAHSYILRCIDSKDHIFQSLKETTIVKNRATFIYGVSYLILMESGHPLGVMIGLGKAVRAL